MIRDRLQLHLDRTVRAAVQLGRCMRQWIDQLDTPPPPLAVLPPMAQDVPVRLPTTQAEPQLEAPTRHHDVAAPAIEVRVTQAVVDRILGDALDHVRGSRGEDETGWVPIGRVEQGVVVIEGLLPKGRGARATPGDFEIDHGHVLAALALAQSRGSAEVVGLVHTHPGRMDYNSSLDQATDEVHVAALAGRVGVYPIVVRERAVVSGHLLRTGLRLAWWGMRASKPGVYVPCRVEVIQGHDSGAWLVDHDEALAEAGDVVLELLERHVEVTLVPAAPGGVDLVATLPDAAVSAVLRFEPEPGAAALAGPGTRRRITGVSGRGRRLGRSLAAALAQASGQLGRDSVPAGQRGAPQADMEREAEGGLHRRRPARGGRDHGHVTPNTDPVVDVSDDTARTSRRTQGTRREPGSARGSNRSPGKKA